MKEARDGLIDIAAVLEDQTGHLEQVARIGDLGTFAGLVCVPRERELCGARQARLIRTVHPHPFTLDPPCARPAAARHRHGGTERRPRLGDLSHTPRRSMRAQRPAAAFSFARKSRSKPLTRQQFQ